jgi:hypothetical protein
MGIALLIFCGLLIYFFPSILGFHKRNATSIILLNLFLGWTLIGWVIALVWATSKDTIVIEPIKKQNISEELSRLNSLKESGVLSEQEFQSAKSKILQ